MTITQIEYQAQRAIQFPKIAISAILNGKGLTEEVNRINIKNKVFLYIQTHGKAYISDISKEFNLDIEHTIQLVNELEKEGRIRSV